MYSGEHCRMEAFLSQIHCTQQKLNSVLESECCCCEQPISTQKFFCTAISLDAHNNNIHNLAQNSASGHNELISVHIPQFTYAKARRRIVLVFAMNDSAMLQQVRV